VHGATRLPRTRLAGFAVSLPTVALDARTGRVFVTNARRDTMRVLTAATGAVLRTVTVGPNPLGVAVDTRTGHVFIANAGHTAGTGSVSMLDAAGGVLLHAVAAGQNPSAVTVDETTERLFVIKGDGVGVLDARTGILLHTVPVPSISSPTVTVDERWGHALVASTWFNMLSQPVPDLNMVWVLDATSGALLRRIPLLHGPIALAVDDHTGHIFSANLDGTVSTLDLRTGAVVRTVALAPLSLGNAVAADSLTGRVFVSAYNLQGNRGHISIVDARSGTLLRTVAVGTEPTAVAIAERTGRVFTIAQSGITILDARSGRVLRTIGVVANAMTVDEQNGRAFVSLGNGRIGIIDTRSGTLQIAPQSAWGSRKPADTADVHGQLRHQALTNEATDGRLWWPPHLPKPGRRATIDKKQRATRATDAMAGDTRTTRWGRR
jgi:YVTN family beta-propeller protein